ncbi:MAG: AhpC/TSA family protein [Ferruginibacter sp.]|nr:AhpC/TSA family protein [Ferruginibacter sp.]
MRSILTLFVLLFCNYSILSQNKYVLSGTIDSIKTGEIWLNRFYPDSTVTDTAKIVNGKYSFAGKLNFPINAKIDIKDGKNDVLSFILEPTSQNINGNGYPLEKWSISGGKINDDYKEYYKLHTQNNLQLKKLQSLYSSTNESNIKTLDSIDSEEKKHIKISENIDKEYIKDHKNKLLSLFIIYKRYTNNFNDDELMPLFNSLKAEVKNSKLGRVLKMKLLEFVETKYYKTAPEIVQKDTNGNILKLSSFRGKYVLVDFWASWCNPCREQNPELVKVYNEYKQNNFTILSVSYDDKLEDWKNAIIEDGLSWYHISELNWWQNSTTRAYKISYVPQNVLVNPQGKIIARNLEGEMLQRKLKSIFKF